MICKETEAKNDTAGKGSSNLTDRPTEMNQYWDSRVSPVEVELGGKQSETVPIWGPGLWLEDQQQNGIVLGQRLGSAVCELKGHEE
jgi:hypothetical protein